MLRVRTFRAVEDFDSCKLFAERHANVLKDYGITSLSSSRNDWFYNPDVYVVIVETEDSSEVVGGERIHIASKSTPLPIENAVSIVEEKIHSLVASYADNGVTGELCGLWNAKSIAGRGVSNFLTKFGVAMAHALKMDSIFVLCAPYTVGMCQSSGFVIETSIGNEGTFVYPKLDLIATALVIKDMGKLVHADPEVRDQIFNFIDNPVNKVLEHGQKGATEVGYNLLVSNHNKINESPF